MPLAAAHILDKPLEGLFTLADDDQWGTIETSLRANRALLKHQIYEGPGGCPIGLIHYACMKNKTPLVTLLLDIDPSLIDLVTKDLVFKLPPILFTAIFGHKEAFDLLRERDPEQLHVADGLGGTLMHAAVANDQLDFMVHLHTVYPALLHKKTNKKSLPAGEMSPLAFAVSKGKYKAASMLFKLSLDALMHAKTDDGRYAIHCAVNSAEESAATSTRHFHNPEIGMVMELFIAQGYQPFGAAAHMALFTSMVEDYVDALVDNTKTGSEQIESTLAHLRDLIKPTPYFRAEGLNPKSTDARDALMRIMQADPRPEEADTEAEFYAPAAERGVAPTLHQAMAQQCGDSFPADFIPLECSIALFKLVQDKIAELKATLPEALKAEKLAQQAEIAALKAEIAALKAAGPARTDDDSNFGPQSAALLSPGNRQQPSAASTTVPDHNQPS